MKKSYLILFCISLIAAVSYGSFFMSSAAITKPSSNRVNSAEPPIILVHGFNQSSEFWDDISLISSLDKKGVIHMGNFKAEKDQPIQLLKPKGITAGKSALYTLSLPAKGTKNIRDSGILLEKAIQEVTKRHQCEKVRLISFSAGGVVCREYLTNNTTMHKVISLTTVSAPHLGSELAWLCVSYKNLKSLLTTMKAKKDGNFVTKNTRKATAYTLDKFGTQIEKWGNDAGIDINSECALMLAEPKDGNYLDKLAQAPHPTDVKYHCIITEENVCNYNWEKLKKDFNTIRNKDFITAIMADNLLDLTRICLGSLRNPSFKYAKLKFRGDGVVSQHSQNINNTKAFQSNVNLTATTTKLGSDHGSPAITAAILNNLY